MQPPERLQRMAQAEAHAHARYGLFGAAGHFGPLVAVHAGPDLPLNAAWHDGSRNPTPTEFRDFEAFCRTHGQTPTIHILSHVAPELLPLLSTHGYAVNYVLHAYGHDLHDPPTPRLNIQQAKDPAAWAALSTLGFGPGSERIMQLVSQGTDTQLYTALIEGESAATAAMSIKDGIAAFFGTSTTPEYRRQGAQTALLAHRLQRAAQQGAAFATVYVTPGTPSEQNIVRAGFQLVGMRLTFSKALYSI